MYVYFLWHRMYRMKWKVMKMNKSILQSTCPIVHLLLPGVWKHWTNYITFWLIFTTLVLFPIYILYTVQCKITGHSLDLSDNVLYDWLFPHTDCYCYVNGDDVHVTNITTCTYVLVVYVSILLTLNFICILDTCMTRGTKQ